MNSLNITSLDKPLIDIPLSLFGASNIDDLARVCFSYGYMIVLLKNGRTCIMNCSSDRILENFNLSQGQMYVLPMDARSDPGTMDSKEILIFSSRDIYKLNLIRDFHIDNLFSLDSASMEIIRQPIYLDERYVLAVQNEDKISLVMVSADGMNELVSVNSAISTPVNIGKSVFFYTEDEVFIYDLNEHKLLYRSENLYNFDINSDPKCEGFLVYAKGKDDKIYRINMAYEVPEIFWISHPQVIQSNFDVIHGQIMVSHSAGVLLMNKLGQVEWSSDQLLNPYPAYKFSPISFGRYIAFVMSYPNTEVLHIIRKPEYGQAASCFGNFMIKPIYYSGQLYTIVEEDFLKMRVYEL